MSSETAEVNVFFVQSMSLFELIDAKSSPKRGAAAHRMSASGIRANHFLVSDVLFFKSQSSLPCQSGVLLALSFGFFYRNVKRFAD